MISRFVHKNYLNYS